MNKDNKILNDKELEKINGGINTDIEEVYIAHNVGAYLGLINSKSEPCQELKAPVIGCFIALPGFP